MRAVLLQYRCLHYRARLFELMRMECERRGVELELVYGQPTPTEATKQDTTSISWAKEVKNFTVRVAGRDLLWQPFPRSLRGADLVIMMQENRLISNYPWLMLPSHAKVAFWGHGRNFQSVRPSGLRERWKRAIIGKVDWWFAYTDLTENVLLEEGYPKSRITVLNNAIDVQDFRQALAAVTEEDIAMLRRELSIPSEAEVALFCGSLYPEKRLEFLIEASDLVFKKTGERFIVVVIGSGPSHEWLKGQARTRSWLKVVGAKHGSEKAKYFRMASVMLNPGLVGLHVIDSFCAGLPMITTADALHSPEISYLVDGENGLIVKGGVEVYAGAVMAMLADTHERNRMAANAIEAASNLTVEAMAERFVEGIEKCLNSPKLR